MHQNLWEVIKQLSESKEFGPAEMELAYGKLNLQEFTLLKEQKQEGLRMGSEQWI